MAINLAVKYSDKIAQVYTASSFIAGKTSSEWDFSGVKSVKIYTPQTVDLVDYKRSGSNRYGESKEMQDTIQELTMSQDKSFSITIDKGNNNEQMLIKNAGKMLKLQIDERVVPLVDKYAFSRFISLAGKVAGVTKPTKATIVSAIADAGMHLDDSLVPEGNRYLYITTEMYNLLRQSGEFLNIEALGTKAVEKGVVGEVMGFKVVKVPVSYLPANAYFIAIHKNSVLVPYKIRDAKVHEDPPGISGALLEGRNNYDAFVIGARANGVYAAVASGDVAVTPAIAIASGKATITSTTSNAVIKYTVDGSDPRYSDTALVYGAAVAVKAGQTVKAFATADGKFTSDVAETTVA